MTTPNVSRASADNSRRCPGGCHTRIPLTLFVCAADWLRLPFHYQQPIQASYRRDQAAYERACTTARAWYRDNPPTESGATP